MSSGQTHRAGRSAFLAALAAAAILSSAPAAASSFHLFRSATLLDRDGAPRAQDFGLGACCDPGFARLSASDAALPIALRFPVAGSLEIAALDPPSPLPPVLPRPAPRPRPLAIGVASLGAIWGSAYNAYSDGPNYDFHFTNEGYFGRNTYVGGGDKASHFVSYYAVSRLMTEVYELFDLPEQPSYGLASTVSTLAGLATEIGDGTNRYGFSYEDFVVDSVGAASAYVLARYRLNDLIGFRAGVIPAPEIDDQRFGNTTGTGKDYSREIYTADLKLAGLSRRLDRRFGPARFLLVSLTYGVKGYPYAPPELRERQVGLEVGLNLAEAARALGVPKDRWWGKMMLIVLDIVRIPYTAIGVRYDINHRQWRGPDTGQTFSLP